MKATLKYFASFFLINVCHLNFVQAQAWLVEYYGDECCILNVTTFYSNDGDSKVEALGGGNEFFETKEECEKAYKVRYHYYPVEHKSIGYKSWIETKYHCAPCNSVYADELKKIKEKKAKKENVIGSRAANLQKAKAAKNCFKDNEDSYNDFINSVTKVADNIFLDDVSCSNGKVSLEWSKHDSNGNKLSISDNERQSIDAMYGEMQQKSKQREINKLAQQIKRAQTVEEAGELLNTLNELLKSNSNDFKPDLSINTKNDNSQSLQFNQGVLSSKLNTTGEREIILDTDNNGYADTRVMIAPGQTPVYQSINGGSMQDANVIQDFLNYSQLAAFRPDADGKLTRTEANDWRHNGGGEPLYVDLSKINLDWIHDYEFKGGVGSTEQFDLRWRGDLVPDGVVYGKITLKYLGNNEVSSESDTYNFDTKKNDYSLEGMERNISNAIGRWTAPDGTPYTIYFYGKGKINKTPVWRK